MGLLAGRQPLRVEWFNGVRQAALRVEYEGPGVVRQEALRRLARAMRS